MVTRVVVLAARSAGVRSAVGEATVALTGTSPAPRVAGTSALTTTGTVVPAATVFRVQVTGLPAGSTAQVVPGGEEIPPGTTVNPGGSGIAKVTPAASDGPLLVTSAV